MRFRFAVPLLLLALVRGSSGPDRADQIPVKPPGPEICNLLVTRDAASVIVTWSGGTPPFSIMRADGPCFGSANELTYLSEHVSGRRYVDHQVLSVKRRFWYQVFDRNSAVYVFSISSGEPKEHDPRTIHPNAPDECGDQEWCGAKRRSPTTWP